MRTTKFKEFQVNREVERTLDGKPDTLMIEATVTPDKRSCFVHIRSLKADFDLCNLHYGYLKPNVKFNHRLRSNKSIEREINEIIDGYIETIDSMIENDKILLYPRTVSVDIKGRNDYLYVPKLGHISWINIASFESGTGVAWHYHDIFPSSGQIDLYVYRCSDTGSLCYSASQHQLYDFTKLRELRESDDFKNEKYAFFKYREVLRLLGEPIEGPVTAMSGLFSRKDNNIQKGA